MPRQPLLISASTALLFITACTATPERVCRHVAALEDVNDASGERTSNTGPEQADDTSSSTGARRLTAAAPIRAPGDADADASGEQVNSEQMNSGQVNGSGGDPANEAAAERADACLESMRANASRLGELWPDVAACFLASSSASDLVTCRDVAIAARAHLACRGLEAAQAGACVRALRVRMRTEPEADVLVHQCLESADTPSGCF
mgnify:CR=1 FL=1